MGRIFEKTISVRGADYRIASLADISRRVEIPRQAGDSPDLIDECRTAAGRDCRVSSAGGSENVCFLSVIVGPVDPTNDAEVDAKIALIERACERITDLLKKKPLGAS